jgi:hypothetical protein
MEHQMNVSVKRVIHLVTVTVFLGVSGCSIGASELIAATPEGANDIESSSQVAATDPVHPKSLIQAKSPVADLSCDPDAAVAGIGLESTLDNPVSKAHSGVDAVKDAAEAIKLARQVPDEAYLEEARSLGWDEKMIVTPKAAAARMSYEDTLVAEGAEVPRGTEAVVSPGRCVWVVTVEEPFIQRHTKPGIEPKVFSSYTAVIDQATGEGIAIYAGPESINVLNGRGFLSQG